MSLLIHSRLSLAALGTVLGASVPTHSQRSSCVNSAEDRSCWTDGFDLSTNYYEKVPDTGVTREYWFTIENGTAAPDGVELPVQLINGSFPGPTIIADWGDTVGEYSCGRACSLELTFGQQLST
jgi:hypothetical protein